MKRKKNSRKTKRRYKPLPVHTWEAHTTSLGEVNKQLIIAVITIIAIIALGTLLFFSEVFVGKAYTGLVDTAGIEPLPVSISPDTPFDLTVKANVGGKETTAVSFRLTLPEGITCTGVDSTLDWTELTGAILTTASCEANEVVFAYATINPNKFKTGEFDVARVHLSGIATAGTYAFDFSSFDLIDLDTNEDVIGNGERATITVAEPECIPDCTGLECGLDPVCGESCGTCFEGETCLNNRCVAVPECTSDADCPEGEVCTENRCVAVAPEEAPEIKIEILSKSTGLALQEDVDTLSAADSYTIKVTITPEEDLAADHLVIVQLKYNDLVKTFIYDTKEEVLAGAAETVEFDHEVAGTGTVTVEAFVWGSWPSEGPGDYLLEKAEVSYEIFEEAGVS